jgi:hypothetical protein
MGNENKQKRDGRNLKAEMRRVNANMPFFPGPEFAETRLTTPDEKKKKKKDTIRWKMEDGIKNPFATPNTTC